MAEDDVVVAKKKRTLLEKYDIPLNHLSYEYVKKCNNGKELERIVKILRSGEEGLYPDLIKCAENRLKEILPTSRVLLVEEPVLTKSMMDADHWNKVKHDIEDWSGEMKLKEQLLGEGGDSLVTADIPDIRSEKTTKASSPNEVRERKKVKSVVPRAYSDWDKYDADKEILKMDLEEEIRKEDLEKKKRLSENDASKKSYSRPRVVGSGDYSSVEKEFLATQEKDKGNEYFKAKEYKLAIEHYSASIAIEPSPVAYNNRAMAFLKQEKYLEALRDCNKVLEMEPNNVKALHRRGIANTNRGSYQNALNDFLKVLRLEPSNTIANAYAQELHVKLGGNQKSVRMQISEEGSSENGPKIVELEGETFEDEPCIHDPSIKINTSWPPLPDRKFKCNEFGLPKIMCNCCGVPDWVTRPPPKCLVCQEIKERRKSERQKLEREKRDVKGETCAYTQSSHSSESTCEHNNNNNSDETDTFSFPNKKNFHHLQSSKSSEVLVSLSEKDSSNTESKSDVTTKDDASVSRESASKSSVSSPKVKSGHKIEARCLLPPESNKAVKVQVASKYTTKTVVKGEEETSRGVQAIQGLTLEDDIPERITPYEFINALQTAKGEDVTTLAQVLQRVDPSELHTLIGNKLDDTMLQSILMCLEKCFLQNGPLVLKFLENLSALPRFSIVNMFLNLKTKQVIENISENLKMQGCPLPDDLKEIFKL